MTMFTATVSPAGTRHQTAPKSTCSIPQFVRIVQAAHVALVYSLATALPYMLEQPSGVRKSRVRLCRRRMDVLSDLA